MDKKKKIEARRARKLVTIKSKLNKLSGGNVRNRDHDASSAKTHKLELTPLVKAYAQISQDDSRLDLAGKSLFEDCLSPSMPVDDFFTTVHEKCPCLGSLNGTRSFESWLISEDQLANESLATVSREGQGLVSADEFQQVWETRTRTHDRLRFSFIRLESIWRFTSLVECFLRQSCRTSCTYAHQARAMEAFSNDVDCYILQVSGSQTCLLDAPVSEEDALPAVATKVLSQETSDSTHVFNLAADQALYIPRGWAVRFENTRMSVHVTIAVSTTTWADLVTKTLNRATERVRRDQLNMRSSVPRNMGTFMGIQHVEAGEKTTRNEFTTQLLDLIGGSVVDAIDTDGACDELVADFLNLRHFPASPDADFEQEDVDNTEDLGLESTVIYRVAESARLCLTADSDSVIVRHCFKNPRVMGFDECEPHGVEFDIDDAPTVEACLANPGNPFQVSSIPPVLVEEGDDPEEHGGRLRVVTALVGQGILSIQNL